MSVFHELFLGFLDLNTLNYAHIVLVQKEGVEEFTQIRPISLLDGTLKIIFIVLANKLRPLMEDLVGVLMCDGRGFRICGEDFGGTGEEHEFGED